jgi:hypothetical protein
VHGEHGAHRVEEIPFPRWVPAETNAAAQRISGDEARATLAMLGGDTR